MDQQNGEKYFGKKREQRNKIPVGCQVLFFIVVLHIKPIITNADHGLYLIGTL